MLALKSIPIPSFFQAIDAINHNDVNHVCDLCKTDEQTQ
jgi:hypothetical protein